MPPREAREAAGGVGRSGPSGGPERGGPGRAVPPPRRRGFVAVDVDDEAPTQVGLDGFQELRRMGLFDDDGRNPPPSWWAR